MAKKKDRKAIEKRRVKSKAQKQKKRQLKASSVRRADAMLDDVWMPPPGSGARPETPDGFRLVSMGQAFMEFGKPIMAAIRKEDELENISEALQGVWNYEITLGGGDEEKRESERSAVLRDLEGLLDVDRAGAEEWLEEMVERKRYLFPEDVQPKLSPMLFMRKTVSYLITPFDYNGLTLSEGVIPPDDDDFDAMRKIELVERYAEEEIYEVWEDFFYPMVDAVKASYEKWLDRKGAIEWSQSFARDVELFLDFLYRYGYDEMVSLRTVPDSYFEEFFLDFLLRKLSAEPHEYVEYLPAIQYFFLYLGEKGYLERNEAEITADAIRTMEDDFLDALREQFS